MSYRKTCKSCPWTNTNNHNTKFKTGFEKMRSLRKIETHKCHMISNDIWGYKSEIDQKNVCIGSKQRGN